MPAQQLDEVPPVAAAKIDDAEISLHAAGCVVEQLQTVELGRVPVRERRHAARIRAATERRGRALRAPACRPRRHADRTATPRPARAVAKPRLSTDAFDRAGLSSWRGT